MTERDEYRFKKDEYDPHFIDLRECYSCEEKGFEIEMLYLEEEDAWFHDECATEHGIIQCGYCGKVYDKEKNKLCPECGNEEE